MVFFHKKSLSENDIARANSLRGRPVEGIARSAGICKGRIHLSFAADKFQRWDVFCSESLEESPRLRPSIKPWMTEAT